MESTPGLMVFPGEEGRWVGEATPSLATWDQAGWPSFKSSLLVFDNFTVFFPETFLHRDSDSDKSQPE